MEVFRFRGELLMIRIPVEFLAGYVGAGSMVLRDDTRECVGVYTADGVEAAGAYSYTVVGDGVVEPPIMVAPAETVVASRRVVSRSTMLARFTDAELAMILSAAAQNVAVAVWVKRFDTAADIDLDDALVVMGVQALEVFGILASGRAGEILNA